MTDNNPVSSLQEIVRSTDRQDAYYRLASVYLRGPEDVREDIRKKWNFGVEWIYPNPRRLACSINEAHSSRERALALLVYEAIMDLRQGDPRDEIMTLAVIYHGCNIAGIDSDSLFKEVASVSSPQTAHFLLDFVKRSPEDRSLEAFMLSVEKNVDGEDEIVPSWAKK